MSMKRFAVRKLSAQGYWVVYDRYMTGDDDGVVRLVGSRAVARAEAIKLNAPVILTTAAPTCDKLTTTPEVPS